MRVRPTHPTRAAAVRCARRSSWNHPAFEHLVCDGGCHFVDEFLAQLWIAVKNFQRFLLLWRSRLVLFLTLLIPQLLARRLLILLDDFLSDHVQNRVLRSDNAPTKHQ